MRRGRGPGAPKAGAPAGDADRASEDEGTGPIYRADPDELLTDRRYRGRLRRDRRGNLVFDDTTFQATIHPDGSLRIVDRANLQKGCTPLAARFDLTDAVMRAMGDDPYRYEKRRFARATAALRAGMRRRHLARIGQRALVVGLPGRLRRLWRRHRRRSPGRLRRLLFELWDECGEAGRSVPRVARLGARARRVILRFVRDELPVGGRLAYSRAELGRLNRRRASRARFEPYRPSGEPAHLPRPSLGKRGR